MLGKESRQSGVSSRKSIPNCTYEGSDEAKAENKRLTAASKTPMKVVAGVSVRFDEEEKQLVELGVDSNSGKRNSSNFTQDITHSPQDLEVSVMEHDTTSCDVGSMNNVGIGLIGQEVFGVNSNSIMFQKWKHFLRKDKEAQSNLLVEFRKQKYPNEPNNLLDEDFIACDSHKNKRLLMMTWWRSLTVLEQVLV